MFVEVNGTLWDESGYREEVAVAKATVYHAVSEVLHRHGFVQADDGWYHEDLDVHVRVEFGLDDAAL